jgi:hypothetical protein
MPDLNYSTNQNTKFNSIEEVLLAAGKINQQQFEALRIEATNSGKSSREVIKESNLVSGEDYALSYSQVYGMEYVVL